MTRAEIIDGKTIAKETRRKVAEAVNDLPASPQLAVILVGDDPASHVYVRSKRRACEAVGIQSTECKLPSDTKLETVLSEIARLNADQETDGILLQLPLPDGLETTEAINKIDPSKDVDGLTEVNAGKLVSGEFSLRPCTPTGCVILAKSALGRKLEGLHVVIVGRSILVGKPVAHLFLEENCTVSIGHSRTKNLPELCKLADILVVAVGRPEMIKSDWLKPGVCVIDVGINRVDAPEKGEGKTGLVGDVDFNSCSSKAAYITPVPGGVGPMTIACLLRNTVLAACARRSWPIPQV